MMQNVQTSIESLKKTHCRYCQTPLNYPFLDLGEVPLANSFLNKDQLDDEEFTCPLALSFCEACKLVQLTHVVDPEVMFSNYLYVSSTTQTFRDHFANYAAQVKRHVGLAPTPLAVDIGSNDGLLLEKYRDLGMRSVGVDPAGNLCAEANRKGLKTIHGFFGEQAVNQILADEGPADAVSANNVFAHIDDIGNVCANVHRLLGPEGIFVVEFPYLNTMLKEMLFDMIYHEHLSYISVHALRFILNDYGLEIFDLDYVSSHGGSLRVFAKKKESQRAVSSRVDEYVNAEKKDGIAHLETYRRFASQVFKVREGIRAFVQKARAENKTISGYGAPAKANTLICFCGLQSNEIKFIVDDNPLKQGMFAPGSKIPVVPGAYLTEHPTHYVILFAWNFSAEILRKMESLRKRGVQCLVPLPAPKLV